MNNRHTFLHGITRCAAVVFAALGFTACSLVYDEEGDCTLTYKVKFVDDYNLHFADGFDKEVETVTLYALDEDGHIAWQHTATKDELTRNDHCITFTENELTPGKKYHLQAWANGNIPNSAPWLTPNAEPQQRYQTLTASNILPNVEHEISTDINDLFHGEIDVELPDDEDLDNDYNRVYVFPMQLTRNTNNINIVVQQIKGNTVDPKDYEFLLTTDNTRYDSHNAILPQGTTAYRAFRTEYYEGEISGGSVDDVNPDAPQDATRATSYPAVKAEITTGRLMWGDNVKIVIRNRTTGEHIVSFPLIDYLMMVRSSHYQNMSEQEYLDRQYDCSIVFLLDEGSRWVPLRIEVLSWRVVLQNTGL